MTACVFAQTRAAEQQEWEDELQRHTEARKHPPTLRRNAAAIAQAQAINELRIEIREFEYRLKEIDKAEKMYMERKAKSKSWLSFFTAPIATVEARRNRTRKRIYFTQERTNTSIRIEQAKAQLEIKEVEVEEF